jgi:DNA-binding MarR family transcriptional regulator
MTRIVQGLEAEGLADRKASPDDARSFIVRPTRKGEQALARARAARLARIEALLAGASDKDLDSLAQTLDRLFLR